MTIFGKNVIVKSADFGHFEGWRFLAQNFATLANFDQQELGTLHTAVAKKEAIFENVRESIRKNYSWQQNEEPHPSFLYFIH